MRIIVIFFAASNLGYSGLGVAVKRGAQKPKTSFYFSSRSLLVGSVDRGGGGCGGGVEGRGG